MATPTDTSSRIARAVSSAIADAGLSENAVALRSGIPQSRLNRKLRGIGTIDVVELALIADVLGVPLADLVAPTEDAA